MLLISLFVRLPVAPVAILLSFVWSAFVNTFEFKALSTSALISEAVWSVVAPVSMPFNLVLSPLTKAPSEGLT